ncbi:OTU domain-containing protein 3-like [Mucor ambiguus]|uniref:OTU domain-containing protein 3-like n=1 Tax=Mucor ambiguus TaxID=91626 RepID=A0A0C9MJG0_9FUNG|nr:OTU domain-containing protein 3-like [Mucor ambiguus]
MAKGKEKRYISEKLTRKQRRAMDKNFFGDPENLDSQLKSLGLCTKSITGDGNCLFRSLSDQYHGHDGNHKAVRQEVCQYLRENEETYKFFVEDDQSFEHHVECMSQDATFGGNMELAAFAKLKKVDIKVYQPGMIYVINGIDDEDEKDKEEEETRQTLHIAYVSYLNRFELYIDRHVHRYHSWEHYSSVRNIDGPYSGPPEIKVVEQSLNHNESTEKDGEDDDNKDEELSSKEKVVRSAFPDVSIRKIRRLLIKHKGDPDKVIDTMYESELKDVHSEAVTEDPATANTLDEASTLLPTPEETISTDKPEQEEQTTDTNDRNSTYEPVCQDTPEQITDEKHSDEIKDEEGSQDQQEKPLEAPLIKPKKLSAAERKKEQKKRQKENKLMKDRAKAARRAGYKQQAKLEDGQEQDTSSETVAASQSMKEMYI